MTACQASRMQKNGILGIFSCRVNSPVFLILALQALLNSITVDLQSTFLIRHSIPQRSLQNLWKPEYH